MRPARAIGWSDVDTEAAMVRRCADGDELACSFLVDQHERMVYQLALHLLGDHEEALDLSQEVFLRVFRTLQRFRGDSTLKTWIYRIVVNQARNRQRWWRRRRPAEQVSLDDYLHRHGDVCASLDPTHPDRIFWRKELAARIWAAVERLPFEQKTAVVLREVDGLSYEEIAFSIGASIGTVKSRLARARVTLRAELRDA